MRHIVVLLAVMVLIFNACKKSPLGSTGGGNSTDLPPAITPVGTPVDSGVTQSIGSGGGTVSSADGRLQVTIPAGDLTSPTTIGVQAVTNNAPGGLGVS